MTAFTLYAFPKLGDIGCQCPKCNSFHVKATQVLDLGDPSIKVYDNRTCQKCQHVGNKYEFMTNTLPNQVETVKVLDLKPGMFIKMVKPAGKIAQLAVMSGGSVPGKLTLTYYGGDFEHVNTNAEVSVIAIH